MANLDGGGEAHARFEQYEYYDPVEEPKTLWGKIDPKSFGDCVDKGRPNSKKWKKNQPYVSARQSKTRRLRAAADEAMFSLIQQQLCGQPLNIVSCAVDEILVVLKSVKNPEKKMEIEKLLNPIPNQVFDQLLSIGKLITDFQEVGDSGSGQATEDEGLDDNAAGVAFEFEKNEEDSDPDMLQEEDDEEDEDTVEPNRRDVADKDSENDWLKGQRQMLVLESLAFDQGGLRMANEKCDLPLGSYRSRLKGYDEFHEPWVSKKVDSNEKLIKITEMPDWAQPAFRGMQQLSRVQSKVYDTALFKAENILLCAPTGKTNVAILTILQQLALNRTLDGSYYHGNYKIVYLASMKALVAEVVGNLSNRLKDYGVTVKELSGDQPLTWQEIEQTQIIVTTPENWDIITRKSGDRTYTLLVRLLIIDEIHLLHDNQGPVLESIVARTLRQIETTKQKIRLVGLSATLPNNEDVALFLRVDLKEGLFKFDRSYRPVPLAQQYIGISVENPLQRFHLMNEICYQKVLAGAGKHQILIFVHSRKETAYTARAIRNTALTNDTLSKFLKKDSATSETLQHHNALVESNDLKDLLPSGFAIHHDGLTRGDRNIVENLFCEGHAQVLVSTTTLARDVKADTVIIKGTQVYNPEKGAWMERSPLDVMQMLGHAGRPQYDQHGEGIIITGYSELQYYRSLMNEQLPIESQLISKLADQLNAEIALGTVQNRKEAYHWLGYTYLYSRMVRNPTLYGLPPDALAKDVEERSADLIHSAATILDKNNLVKYDRKSGYFQVTDLGRIANYYYITHGTIASYNKYLKPTMGDIDLFRLFSLSEEFKYVTARQDEKTELAELLHRVRIPIKETLEEPSAKINVLLQAYISQLELESLSLTSDMIYITQSAGRLVQALFEIVLKRGWAQLAEKALNLSKMVGKRMWSVQTPLRQFREIPNEILMKLEKKDLGWERYYDLSSQELEELLGIPKSGRLIHKCVHQIPKLNLAAHIRPITPTVLLVELTITPDFQWDDKIHNYVEPFWIIVEDNDGKKILHHQNFRLEKQYIDEDHTLNFTVPIFEPLPPRYFIRVVSHIWIGSHTVLPLSLTHVILPKEYPPPTELLDLQPLPVADLRKPYSALYQDFKHFNPVQTQVFNVLYNTDANVLVAAPTGSGKTICAEFAILRNHQGHDATMRVVYIAPLESIAKKQFRDWETKFRNKLGLEVVELTGETALDLKLLEKSQIIISTPEKWDALSRRWKQRKYVQQVSLFIVDELHLIGGQGGPVLEVIVSRMRYISSQVENKIRIVALSTSLANAEDFGEWTGASSHGLFNFPPGARPVPLEIHIQGVDISSFEARMQAMTKPTYTAIVQHAKNKKPAIIFVPTRKHVCSTAVDLMTYSNMDNPENPDFLLGNLEELEPFVNLIHEETLKETLRHGVGYLHEGLIREDQETVTKFFEAGWIQVCVMSSSLCWGTTLTANLTVVMGTQYCDERENSHSAYPVSDLLQMMGRSSRPLLDNAGKCVIFCHVPDYYRKFLHEALPVESDLHHFLHDNLNSAVVAGVIENRQDAFECLTWTFMYRRVFQNPNYYNLQEVSHMQLSEHLAEFVENTLSELKANKCIEIKDDKDISPLKVGMAASNYQISYTTIERFNSLLTSETNMEGLIEILTSASEYDHILIRPGEEENPECRDPHMKANALLQAHFSRQNISGNLAMDQRQVLLSATRLLQAMVYVISDKGWLNLALLAIKVSQMVARGMWQCDSMLLQFPHFTKDLAKKCEENPGKSIKTLFDLMEMSSDERQELLQMLDSQLHDIDEFCNRFTDNKVTYEVVHDYDDDPPKEVTFRVMVERDMKGKTEVRPLDQLRYHKEKEGLWLVMGEFKTDHLLAIKRVSLQQAKMKLDIAVPNAPRGKWYTLYLMRDSYLGCDKELSFSVDLEAHKRASQAGFDVFTDCSLWG